MSQHVRIQVRLPEGHWSGDVSRSLPSLVLRIEETMPLGKGRGTATLSASDENPELGLREPADMQRGDIVG